MWVPRFVCPECSVEILDASPALCGCGRCGNGYTHANGLWHFLTPARAAILEPFLRQYRAVRERDGRRAVAADYYRTLPWVAADDPHSAEWQIRRATYGHLLRHVLGQEPASMRILDLGAGNAWLSHRLAALGHRVVAVDALDDQEDGLGASRYYAVRFPAIQADYDALPLAPQQFDLVVFNGSLHYAPDPAATMAAARRMLVPGGAIAVMDSPMFVDEADGRAMVGQMAERFSAEYGLDRVVQPGPGYLTFALVDDAARALRLRPRFVTSQGSVEGRVRRWIDGVRLRRAPASFGLWVGKGRVAA